MTDSLVSVIVPVYNVEAYLPRCLECIRAQSYTNLEIILVDDGSTDSSGRICDEYAASDPRARVFHHETNRGLPAARNTGQHAATGEYLWFLDSDDYFHKDIIKVMHEAINRTGPDGEKYDLAIVGYEKTDRNYNDTTFEFTYALQEETVYNLLLRLVQPLYSSIPLTMWIRLFRRQLLDGVYTDNYTCCEDQDFNIKVLLKEPRVIIVKAKLYYWYQRSSSITHQSDFRSIQIVSEIRILYKHCLSLSKTQKNQYGAIMYSALYWRMADLSDLITESDDEIKQEILKIASDTWCAYLFTSGVHTFSKRIKLLSRIRFNRLYRSYLACLNRTKKK